MKRIRRAWPGIVALSVAAVVLPLLGDTAAQAVGSDGGGATIVPATGTGATSFTLTLPSGAACTGDTASGQYEVTSYVVPATVNPATLTFDSLVGPNPNGVGPSGEFRQPLYRADTGEFYTGIATANASSAGGPGPVVNIPQFSFNAGGFTPGQIPAGAYNVGIACIKGVAGPNQVDKYFNTRITVTANPSGGLAQISYVTGAVPDAPTLSSPLGVGVGSLTATFTPGATSVPATTGYTASAVPTGGGSAITANGSGSPITITGLTNGTSYAVTVVATNTVGNSAPSNSVTGTPGDFVAPGAPTVSITDPINVGNQASVVVSGTGETGATANISVDDTNAGTPAVTTTAPVAGGSYSANVDVSGLDDGTLTATVTQTDAANNTGPAGTDTATKDTTPDAPTVAISPDPINATNQTAVTVSGVGEANGTANISVDDANGATPAVTTSVPTDGSGAYAATLDLTSLTDGTITASVTVTNSVNHTGPAGTDTAVKQANAPANPLQPLLDAINRLVQQVVCAIRGVLGNPCPPAGGGTVRAGLRL